MTITLACFKVVREAALPFPKESFTELATSLMNTIDDMPFHKAPSRC